MSTESEDRYAAFAGATYYPCCGFEDFVSWHDSERDAVRAAKGALAKRDEFSGWWQVWFVSRGGTPACVAEGTQEELS